MDGRLFRRYVGRIGRQSADLTAQTTGVTDEIMEFSQGNIKTKWLDLDYGEVNHGGESMRFALTGSSSVKRVRSLFSKEPITLAWIDSFTESETVYDIGANVGMYTIYAAVMRNAAVYALSLIHI